MSDTTSTYRIVFHSLPQNDYQPALWRLQKSRWWGWETIAVNNKLRIDTLLIQLRELENGRLKEAKP